MSVDPAQVRAIFLDAVEGQPPDDWDQFLDGACGGEAELRRQVARLLDGHRRAGGFLAQGVVAPARAVDPSPVQEGPGAVIGPYRLIEPIGEGGFGVIFLAEQTHPVRRKVALKVLKPGMDTHHVVTRFEAERQALALMDHPNIAKVLDGGLHEGRPFFVMELVKGVPITEFCDDHHLTPRQRLGLFIQVCAAVQHAHQKGVIHRDLKPSNVLVAMYDGAPVPKVIDFGVAKAIGQQLTERSLHTGFWGVVGTLEYMSPEQASFSHLDVDTRSDVYSLGILLYELLTGSTPLGLQRARDAGMLEALRIIRDEEPPSLSSRVSTTAGLASIAARRGLEPAHLTKQVRGELNWIVMTCLERDRNRRYQTANGVAADVRRYLSDEPVQACPPSAGYRLRKFARRNKATVLAVTAGFMLLIAGIGGTTWGLVRAEHARQAEARQRKLAEAAVASERRAKGAEAEERDRAEKALHKAAREAAVAAAINDFLNKDLLQLSSPVGQANQGLTPDADLKLRTVLQRAARRIDGKFAHQPEVEMKLRSTIGDALYRVGDYAGALAQYQKVAPYSRDTLGPDHPKTLMAELRFAGMHRLLGHNDLALPLLEASLEKHEAVLGPEHSQTLLSMNTLASAYSHAGRAENALPLFERIVDLRRRHLGPTHPDTLVGMNNVASVYQQLKQLDKALPLFEETLAAMQSKLPPLHPERLNTTRNLSGAYHAAERLERAVPLLEMVMRQFKSAYGLDDTMTQAIIDNLIEYDVEVGRCDKAETLLSSIQSDGTNRATHVDRQQQDLREKRHRDLIQQVRPAAADYQRELAAKKADHPDTIAARQALAVVLRTQNRNSAAAYHLQAVLDARRRLLGDNHPDTQSSRLELGTTRVQQCRYSEAESLLLEALAGLQQHESTAPQARSRLVEALRRLVQLYEGWGKNDRANEWRKKLGEHNEPSHPSGGSGTPSMIADS